MATDLGSAYASLRIRFDELRQDVDRVNGEFERVADSVSSSGQSIMDFGKNMMKVGGILTASITVPMIALAQQTVSAAADFEYAMATVEAVTRASADAMTELSAVAEYLGATTRYSAVEAAEGMAMLGRAGWETHEIIEGIPGVLDLAAAGALELGRAADIVSDMMRAFGEEADQAGRYADVMAEAAAIANTTVEKLGDAMAYGAASANMAGMEIEEATALMIALSDAGVKGTRAGTAFEAAMRELRQSVQDGKLDFGEFEVAVYDSEGAMRDIIDIIGDMESGLDGMTDQQRDAALGTIFTTRSLRAMNLWLTRGSEELRGLETNLLNSEGAAKRMADVMMDTLRGAFIELSSALEGLKISFGRIFLPLVRTAVEYITELVRWVHGWDQSLKETLITIGIIAAAIGPLVLGLGGLVTVFGLMVKNLPMIITLFKTGSVVLLKWLAPIIAITYALVKLNEHMSQELIPTIDLFGDEVSATTQDVVGEFLDMSYEVENTLQRLIWAGDELSLEAAEKIVQNFEWMGERILSNLESHEEEITSALSDLFEETVLMSEYQQAEILAAVESGFRDREREVEEAMSRVNDIYERAYEEERAITEAEMKEILALTREMRDTGIEVLSETARDAAIIRQRMAEQAEEMSARQAAAIIKDAIDVKERTIQEAEEQYEGVLIALEMLREAGDITEEQYQLMLAEAQNQRDGAIEAAEEMHGEILSQAKEHAGEYVDAVDWQTGEVLDKYDQMFKKVMEMEDYFDVWDFMKEAIKDPMMLLETGAATIVNFGEAWEEMNRRLEEGGGLFRFIGGAMSDFFGELLGIGIDSVKEFAEGVGDYFSDVYESAIDWFSDIGEIIAGGFEDAYDGIRDFFTGLVGDIDGWFSNIIKSIKTWFAELPGKFSDFVEPIYTFFRELPETIKGFLYQLFVVDIPYMIGYGLGTMYRIVVDTITEVIEWFQSLPERISKGLTLFYELVVETYENMKESVIEFVSDAIEAVIEWFQKLPERVKSFVEETKDRVVDTFIEIKETMETKAKEALDAVIRWFQELPGNVRDFLVETIENVRKWASDMVERAREAASDFIKSVIDRIKSLPGDIWNILLEIIRDIIRWGSTAATNAIASAKQIADGFISEIRGLPGRVWGFIVEIGQKLMNAGSYLYNLAKDAASNLVQGFLSGAEKNSPSAIEIAMDDILNETMKKMDQLVSYTNRKGREFNLEAKKFEKAMDGPSMKAMFKTGAGEGLMIDYERLGKVIAANQKSQFSPSVTISGEQMSSPSDKKREEEKFLRRMAMEWGV